MSFLFDNVPLQRCLVRGEYLRNLEKGHDEWVEGVIHAVRCRRGFAFHFQVALLNPYGGAQFLLPIQALTWRKGAPVRPLNELQPWDCLADTFSVVELRLLAAGAVSIIPKIDTDRGQYRFSIDFGCEDLADDPEQHKTLHIVYLDDGNIGAYPNNRLIFHDRAFWDEVKKKPDFESLNLVSRGEAPVFEQLRAAAPVGDEPICEQPVVEKSRAEEPVLEEADA